MVYFLALGITLFSFLFVIFALISANKRSAHPMPKAAMVVLISSISIGAFFAILFAFILPKYG